MNMALLDEKTTAELAASFKKASAVAKTNLEEKVTKQTTRLRSSAKTRKSAATRERIMAAATEIMVERGNTDFQMSEVSTRCKMSKGALYYYFSDRDALVEAIFDRSIEELVNAVEQAVSEANSAIEALVRLTHVVTERMSSGSPLALALTREVVDANNNVIPTVETHFARIISIIGAQLERAKVEGVIRPDVDSRIGALAISGSFILPSLALEATGPKGEEETSELADALIDVMLNGMGTAQTKAEINAALNRVGKDAESGKDGPSTSGDSASGDGK